MKKVTRWFVWKEASAAAPVFEYRDEEHAEQKAKALAIEHPGTWYYVLQTVSACRKSDVEWILTEDAPEAPF